MGVGLVRRSRPCLHGGSQYLLHQVWVSDGKSLSKRFWMPLSQYLLHQVWVSDVGTGDRQSLAAVSIPSSSGMGVGPLRFQDEPEPDRLNTFFIRYGCRTLLYLFGSDIVTSQYLLHQVWVSDKEGQAGSARWAGLNTFFIRYGCRTLCPGRPSPSDSSQYLLHQVWVSDPFTTRRRGWSRSLNTFFIRYGCRTMTLFP